jgi:hypothetical protein
MHCLSFEQEKDFGSEKRDWLVIGKMILESLLKRRRWDRDSESR